jgi:hypothetical protein
MFTLPINREEVGENIVDAITKMVYKKRDRPSGSLYH